MQERERKEEAGAMSQGEKMGREEMVGGVVTPMMRGAYAPTWYSRISWGSVFAGVFIAIAAQLMLSALGVLIGFGTASITDINDLSDIAAAVGIWTAISALIATFIGGLVASRLANAQFTSDGIWHGATVWAFALVVSIFLSTFGVSGLLGFAGNALSVLRGVVPEGGAFTPEDLRTAANIVATSAGYFILGSLLSLAAALLGGWLGSSRRSRSQTMREEAGRERMAA